MTLHVRRTPSPSFTACDFGSISKCGVRLRVGSSSGSDGIAGVGRFFPAEPDSRAAAVAGDRFIPIGTAISSSSISLIVSSLVLLPLVEDLIGKSSKVGRMSSVSSAEISIVMSEVTSVMNDVLSDSRSDSSVASAFTTTESACFVDPRLVLVIRPVHAVSKLVFRRCTDLNRHCRRYHSLIVRYSYGVLAGVVETSVLNVKYALFMFSVPALADTRVATGAADWIISLHPLDFRWGFAWCKETSRVII